MIAVIVYCDSSGQAGTCESLMGDGLTVFAVGRPMLPHDGKQDRWNPGIRLVTCTEAGRWPAWNTGIGCTIMSGDEYDEAILLDGHCVPQVGLAQAHHAALGARFPVISSGRCLEQGNGWRDSRNGMLFTRDGTLIQNVSLVSAGGFACGNMGINRPACRRLAALHREMGETGVFPCTDGQYGNRIAYAAWLMQISMWMLPLGANAMKALSSYVPDGKVGHDDSYVSRLRKVKVTLDMLSI